MKVKMAVTTMAGTARGRKTLISVRHWLAPSIQAASSRSRGMVTK